MKTKPYSPLAALLLASCLAVVPGCKKAQAPDAARHREAAIQVISGSAAGKKLDLAKELTTVGKPGTEVAAITNRPDGYFITHVEGENKATVNGAPLGVEPRRLNDHDVIEIAGVKLEFFYKP
jgi:hypothetical protein